MYSTTTLNTFIFTSNVTVLIVITCGYCDYESLLSSLSFICFEFNKCVIEKKGMGFISHHIIRQNPLHKVIIYFPVSKFKNVDSTLYQPAEINIDSTMLAQLIQMNC